MDLRDIADALKGRVSGSQVLAPGPGHRPEDRSLSVRLNAGAPDGFWTHSFSGDDWRTCREHVRACLRIAPGLGERKQPAPNSRGERENIECRERVAFVSKKIEAIVHELVPLCGTPAQRYLREARGIDVTAIGDVLERRDAVGWHPAVLFKEPGHAVGLKPSRSSRITTSTEPAKKRRGNSSSGIGALAEKPAFFDQIKSVTSTMFCERTSDERKPGRLSQKGRLHGTPVGPVQ
jgi:hypothetical protein